jgi:predicted O-methyltransferase YrrM
LSRRYQAVIDIGAAEGYYAVGLAWRMPTTQVTAFEARQDCQAHLLALAELNNVADRIRIHGFCTPELLSDALATDLSTLVFCDCEGGERDLLDPVRIAALRRADILVELHDFLSPGVAELIRARFSATHEVIPIAAAPRSQDDWPSSLSAIPQDWRRAAMEEDRAPGQAWFFLSAHPDA